MLKLLKATPLKTRIQQISASFFSSKTNPFDDFSAAENLFNNSERTHKPVANSDALLKKFRIEKDLKKFAPRKHRKYEPKNILQPKQKTVIKEESYSIQDEETGLEITILGLNDKLTNAVFTNIRSKKQRDKNGKIVIEGRRLILDALSAGLVPEILFFSDKDQLKLIKDEIKPYKNLNIYKVPRHDLKIWSTLMTTPGILAIFPRPNDEFQVKRQAKVVPLTVICDNIREPSNLGSIIRSCAAVPCSQVIVLKGSCDPWDSKCLRGGCGAQFRVNIKDDVKWEDLDKEEFFPFESQIFLAESNINHGELFKQVDYSECEYSKDHNVVVIGGETHGLSDDAYRLVVLAPFKILMFKELNFCRFLKSRSSGKLLHIPLAEGVDSLNSASALTVLLFEIRKSLK